MRRPPNTLRLAVAGVALVVVDACGPSAPAFSAGAQGPTLMPSATAPSPAGTPIGVLVPDQPMEGAGWRIILASTHAWPAIATVFPSNAIAYADSPVTLSRLWSQLEVTAPPVVDLNREVVAALGVLVGEGVVCGQVKLQEITFAPAAHEVVALVRRASDFESLPPAPSGVVAACSGVGISAMIVVALSRDHLPTAPFLIRIDESDTSPSAQAPEIEIRPTP